MTPHRGPQILSSAIIDSVATRFNDLPLKLCEHWESVLSSGISHAALSLHQRHINRFVSISENLLDNAKRLVKQIDAIIHYDEKTLVEPSVRQRDYVSAFSRRCRAYLERCERLQDHIVALKEQYRTSLDESRNWMTTALTLFTAGTFPLTFLTGYFGMNFQVRIELNCMQRRVHGLQYS